MILIMQPVPRDTRVFSAVAEPHRRTILDFLGPAERPVGEVVAALGLTQPSVSKHLRVLREAGLVQVRRDGRRMLYRTDAGAIRPLHDWAATFERYWGRKLSRIKQRAESIAEPGQEDRDPPDKPKASK